MKQSSVFKLLLSHHSLCSDRGKYFGEFFAVKGFTHQRWRLCRPWRPKIPE